MQPNFLGIQEAALWRGVQATGSVTRQLNQEFRQEIIPIPIPIHSLTFKIHEETPITSGVNRLETPEEVSN